MLVYGTANPIGYNEETYSGVYLTNADMENMSKKMRGVDVKIEHRGKSIGKVESCWIHNGRMDVVLNVDESLLDGAFAKEFISQGVCKELSLGYKMQMECSAAGKLVAKNKEVMEVSVVRRGARPNCDIRGWS